jgi:hypothetical protein
MLVVEKVWKSLQAAIDDFLRIDDDLLRERRMLRDAMATTGALSATELRNRLGWPDGEPGAFPTEEWQANAGFWLDGPPLGNTDASSQRWREWAESTLAGVHTFAVDGSQIYPSSDWSIPIAAVQIGWFENPHGDGAYVKDVDFKLISPAELTDAADEAGMRTLVNLERHQAEVEALVKWMRDQAGAGGKRLALFDGTLVVSYASGRQERRRYVEAVRELMKTSAETRVPLVAYIDSSRARDLAHMFATAAGQEEPRITDGTVLPDRSDWGARTPAFICARRQGLDNYADMAREVCFLYLKSNRDGRPARLEFPGWMLREGRLDETVDWVRAEIVAQGNGFPYAIETADEVAVLTMKDRDRMMALVQDFAIEHNLRLDWRAKSRSKRLRR